MNVHAPRHGFVRNVILAGIHPDDLAAVRGFLEPVALKERTVLHQPKTPIDYIYFVESGVVSLRIVADGNMLETAVEGSRGAVGASYLFGGCISPHQSIVLLPGSALRIATAKLYDLMTRHSGLQERLQQYVQALTIHKAIIGVCGIRHDLESRLACWLCVACDTLDGTVLPITHDVLSSALGLRRAGVTEALLRFERDGLIRKQRGILRILDGKRLQQRSCSCYGKISYEYEPSRSISPDVPQAQLYCDQPGQHVRWPEYRSA